MSRRLPKKESEYIREDRFWGPVLFLFDNHPKLNPLMEYIDFCNWHMDVTAMKIRTAEWDEGDKFIFNLALSLFSNCYEVHLSDMDYCDPETKALAFKALSMRFHPPTNKREEKMRIARLIAEEVWSIAEDQIFSYGSKSWLASGETDDEVFEAEFDVWVGEKKYTTSLNEECAKMRELYFDPEVENEFREHTRNLMHELRRRNWWKKLKEGSAFTS